MRKLLLGISIPLLILLAACNPVPPTTVMVLVTNTPDPNVIQVTVTPNPQSTSTVAPTTVSNPATSTPVQVTLLPTSLPSSDPIVTVVSPGPTQTLNPCPTETHAQLYIAQQTFEHGFVFWISTQKVIWVLFADNDDLMTGEWRSYEDTFQEGEAEADLTLTQPANLYQPRRGFGKLWRNTPEVKSRLGWGTTPEFNVQTSYAYIPNPANSAGPNGTCNRLPGTHVLVSLQRETFEITEPEGGVWPGKWHRTS
jgi:hypothetical protein